MGKPRTAVEDMVMRKRLPLIWSVLLFVFAAPVRADEPMLRVGFGERNVSPQVGQKPVYMAGFGKNRLATGIRDRIMARAVVFADDKSKIAIASVDVIGLFHPFVEKIRKRVPGFSYVLVSSSHNHEGPDTLGLWGPNSLQSGLDPDYIKKIIKALVGAMPGRPVSAAGASTHRQGPCSRTPARWPPADRQT